ncbi:MAG: hypothetical protein QOG42_1646 [Solirubrobacteraceae bacterium]|jgi:hypothetical protein|nr:hypothetical protein [Solirubrobacteraceae bacterium]
MRAAQITLTVALVAAIAATSASALSTRDRISHSGLGPIKLGMTERQIERAAKRPIRLGVFPGADCALATLAGKTQGLFTGRRLWRIYIRTPRFATKEGVRVGNTEQRVLAAYPGLLRREPQKFTPEEDDLILRKGDRKVIFSLAKGHVAEISTGRRPEIDLVEGCA